MANQKDLMKLSANELIALGSQSGLTFHAGMKKSHMVQQLSASAASGWMDTNAELMGGSFEDDSLITESFGDSSMISDAAHIAQMLSGAGYTESFHNAMNGPLHHVEAINTYMERLGVNTDDVWMHMPKSNPNLPQGNFNMLNAYMRDTLQGHQDIMPEIPGHYAGDIMAEYSTNRGNIADSYNYMAHMYVDREQYGNHEQYARDISRVAKRLEQELPSAFKEIGYTSASNVGNKSAPHISYMDALPQIGSPSIVSGIAHPRAPLNASGLPLGSYGSGINPEYSLTASLTGGTGWSEPSKALYSSVSEAVKSAAKVYSGSSGMMNTRHEVSDRDMIMDSATRYADLEEARSGYANLRSELADEPAYSASSVRAILENTYDKMDAEPIRIPEMKAASQRVVKDSQASSTEFTAQLGEATNWNSARMRREELAIARMDSAGFRDVSDYGTGRSESPVRFHDLEQGSQEWLDFRKNYDVTGSTVGTFLGNNSYTRPWAGMIDKIGLSRSKEHSDFTKKMFADGHRTEEEARARVGKEFGFDIKQTGAITNDNYPAFMYSPDGLIGDDAIWEHKNPQRAGKFADLLKGDHPDYMDQVQFGMHVSGRSRALFSQTINDETRSQWIDKDEGWYERNRNRLDSVLGRLDAGREFVRSNSGLDREELIAGARSAMTGDGIWKDVRQKSTRGYSAAAGTSDDPFIGSRSSYNPEASRSDYQPNFVMHDQNFPATTGNGDTGNDSMALSVKKGILAAQEENKQRGIGADADFDGKADSMGWDRERFDAANGGGYSGGGGGRGGNFTSGGNYFDDYGRMGGSLAAGIAGGSIGSASNGVMQALMATPAGRVAAVGIGAIQIGNEAAEYMNDFIGNSLDAGVANPNEYSSMSQGLEMLGLNSQQASRLNQTTHSAYNTMLNGDPSGAVNIVRGSRGLLTIGDIRATGGDPVALARIMQERGQERGWSQARIAGAAEMAGLQGMARAYDRTEYSHEQAGSVVEAGRNSDFAEGMAQSEMLQGSRARVLPSYNVPQSVLSNGAPIFEAGSAALDGARTGFNQAREFAGSVYDFIAQEESGGREYNKDGSRVTSPTGARGIMQVLPSTARDPGYGIKPSDGTPDDDARVGREYYDAMYKRYGDHEKAMAAYTDGAGTVDKAIDKNGLDWLTAVPTQAQNRVKAFREWSKSSQSLEEGATGFTRNGMSYGQTQTVVNVKIDAKVNNQTASATVAIPGGQTVTQQMNMNNGAQQRR